MPLGSMILMIATTCAPAPTADDHSLQSQGEAFLVPDHMAVRLSDHQVVTITKGVVDTRAGRATEDFTLDGGCWLNPYCHLHDQ
jgi:hypothetical protein